MNIKTELFSGLLELELFLNKIGWDRVLQVCMNDRHFLVIYKSMLDTNGNLKSIYYMSKEQAEQKN